MYYYRTSYYDPSIGRFLLEDPIGLSSGDINFYVYVGNNPINFINPLGLYFGPPIPIVPTPKPVDPPGCCQGNICCDKDLKRDSPDCDKYGDRSYYGSSLKCFCKCAGDSEWEQRARGCLSCMEDTGFSDNRNHKFCYGVADKAGFDKPNLRLYKCYLKCL